MTTTVYSRPTCAPCRTLKMYLSQKGVDFINRNIDDDPQALKEAYSLAGYSIVPVTVVEKEDGSRSIITGLNLPLLASALQ